MSIPKKILFEAMSWKTKGLVAAAVTSLIAGISLPIISKIRSNSKSAKAFKDDVTNWAMQNNLNPMNPADKQKIAAYAKQVAPKYAQQGRAEVEYGVEY